MYVKIEVGEVTCHDFFSFLFLSFFFIGNWEGFFFFFFHLQATFALSFIIMEKKKYSSCYFRCQL